MAAKKHHDAKEAPEEQEAPASQQAQPGEPAQPAETGGLSPETMQRLKELGELHEQNVLTDEEFEREKAKLLQG